MSTPDDPTSAFNMARFGAKCFKDNQSADAKRSNECLDNFFQKVDPKSSNQAQEALKQYRLHQQEEKERCTKPGVAEYDGWRCCTTLDGTTLGEQVVLDDQTAIRCNNSWR